ncbi:testican-1-like [Crotalus adamanteus]|uniref:Testican-1-like n=1 Tax=Crotalus adamanteus TaxID=8729 RepID=A0AAW1BWD4_CROAD
MRGAAPCTARIHGTAPYAVRMRGASPCAVPPPVRCAALDPSKDPCLKVKCSPHKVCVTHDYETATCVSRKQLVHSLRQKKGNLPQRHWAGSSNLVKCKPCPLTHASSVCGSDGHTYTTKV